MDIPKMDGGLPVQALDTPALDRDNSSVLEVTSPECQRGLRVRCAGALHLQESCGSAGSRIACKSNYRAGRVRAEAPQVISCCLLALTSTACVPRRSVSYHHDAVRLPAQQPLPLHGQEWMERRLALTCSNSEAHHPATETWGRWPRRQMLSSSAAGRSGSGKYTAPRASELAS